MLEVRKWVQPADYKPLPEEREVIVEEVKAKLAAGETAKVFIGSREEILKQIETGKGPYFHATVPDVYTDMNSFQSRMSEPIETYMLPGNGSPKGYVFVSGSLFSEPYLSLYPEKKGELIFGESSGGHTYAYEAAKYNHISRIVLQYRKGNDLFDYYSSYGRFVLGVPTLNVLDPQPDNIIKLNGRDAYLYEHEKGRTLIWKEKREISILTYNYSVSSETASRKQLTAFAEALIGDK